MYRLFNIYDCPNCGKVLSDEVTYGESIDTDNDKIYPYIVCNKCGHSVEKRTSKDENGEIIECYEEVDEERALWFMGFYDEEKEIF